MLARVLKRLKNSKGATAIEYALIASLIAVVAIGAMRALGTKLTELIGQITKTMANGIAESQRQG